jgi:adenosylcobinamide kinase/adenosylcobinamide-phosphate guanylyltransferase
MHDSDADRIRTAVEALADTVQAAPASLILVSNEVGSGIVPENRLARRYRDLAGWTNQALAAVCERVVWTVAGIPVTIKPSSQQAVQ